MKIYILLYTLVLFLILPIKAESSKESKSKVKNSFIGSPIITYSPETKLAFGGAGSYTFKLTKSFSERDRLSIASLSFIYTVKKQLLLNLNTDLYSKNQKYRFTSFIGIRKYPDRFYGIGNSTTNDMEEVFTSKSFYLSMSLRRNLVNRLYGGLQVKYIRYEITEFEEGGIIDIESPLGIEKGTSFGLGLILASDTRDHSFYPTKGSLLEVGSLFYLPFLGSDFKFSTFHFDFRKFIRIKGRQVIALQLFIDDQYGAPPFNLLAQFGVQSGGSYTMRGYYQGRFRDRKFLTLQAEYRAPLFWRLGYSLFAGFGDVAHTWETFNFTNLKYSFGFGLHYLFSKSNQLRIRMNMGFGKDTQGIYFNAFESF
jgi:outer membrane protein assembly factor BamA